MTLRRWRTLSSEVISDNEWNALRRDEVQLPDGSTISDYYVSLRPDIAIVFAVTVDGDVVLVRQYKHGAGEITTELPSGTFASGTAATNARRELREETGYEAPRLRTLGQLWSDATKNTNRVHAFLAPDARLSGPQELDDIEARSGLEVVLRPLDAIPGLIERGVIRDQASVVTCLLALSRLCERSSPGRQISAGRSGLSVDLRRPDRPPTRA